MNQSNPANRTPDITAEERGQLLRLAYRFCWNRSDAEDALHNALLVAIEKADQLRDPAKRWSWLCRVVVQQCHLLGRKQQRRNELHRAAGFSPRGPTNSENSSLRGRPRGSAPATQTSELEKSELGDLMRRLLTKLPAQQRAAMTLRHIERLDYPQIAYVMAISESTVRAHVRAGRDALRTLIQARHPEWQV